MDRRLRVAVAGVGGYAGEHHRALRVLERQGECHVVGTCDPDPARLQEAGERFGFSERGVVSFSGLGPMLERLQPDVVTLPTPIPLHAEQHSKVVGSRAACYLEKPPSLWFPEFQLMLARGTDARFSTHVGFNFTGDPWRRAIKERILAGEFGLLKEARLLAFWPRGTQYYGRNDWGGRLKVGDRWVLDSPIGNAMAHYVQNLLFWGGNDGVDSVARPAEVKARLYRGHTIQSYDTAFVEAMTEGGTRLSIAATHTGVDVHREQETLILQRARIVFPQWRRARIEYDDGSVEDMESPVPDQRVLTEDNIRRYLSYVRGEVGRPITRLSDSESFVGLCDMALISSGVIVDFDPSRITRQDGHVVVQGLQEQMTAFDRDGTWPEASGLSVKWNDLPRLVETAEGLVRGS